MRLQVIIAQTVITRPTKKKYIYKNTLYWQTSLKALQPGYRAGSQFYGSTGVKPKQITNFTVTILSVR